MLNRDGNDALGSFTHTEEEINQEDIVDVRIKL